MSDFNVPRRHARRLDLLTNPEYQVISFCGSKSAAKVLWRERRACPRDARRTTLGRKVRRRGNSLFLSALTH